MYSLRDRVSHVEFGTTIKGIPCRIEAVIQYGHDGGQWEPPCDTEVSVTVLDRGGRPAPWLERMRTDEDKKRIENEALEHDAEQWSEI